MLIPFPDWTPDHTDFGNPGVTKATNVVPATNGYAPVRALVEYSGATTNRVLGAASGIGPAGTVETFAGDSGKLYKLSNTTWNDVSIMAGYSTASGERWRFERFGDLLIATNYSDAVQYWQLGTSSAFANMAATAPKARYVSAIRDHLFLGYVNDSADGVVRNRVWFSPIGDPTDNSWGTTSKQSDFQTLYNADQITGIAGGEYGLIFAEKSIYRATYTGDAAIYAFEQIDRNIGCIAPDSLAQARGLAFFLSADGFYAHDGAQAVPIGTNKVDQYFYDTLLIDAVANVTSVVDPTRKTYYVGYPDGSNGDYPSRILAYRWDLQRWSEIEANHDILVRLFGAGFTLEQLDNISSSIDTFPESLDSSAFLGGGVLFGAFKDDKKLYTFGGDVLDATIDTAEAQLFEPEKSFIRAVRPMVQGSGTVTVQVGSRDNQDDTVSWSTERSLNTRSDRATFRDRARYHRVRLNVSGNNWTRAFGVDVDATKAGRY